MTDGDLATQKPVLRLDDEVRRTIVELRADEPNADSLALWVEVSGANGDTYTYDVWFQALSDAATGFVNVAVQPQQGLVLLDDLSYGLTTDGPFYRLPAPVANAQVRVQVRSRIEPAVVRRHMQVEDRALGGLELLG